MTDPSDTSAQKLTSAQEIFQNSEPDHQTLIRDILKEERDLMHLKRRPEIHQKICDHIKRVIK